MQNLLPLLQFIIIVKPIFAEHRQDIIIDNRKEPFVGTYFSITEIAMSDTEPFSK